MDELDLTLRCEHCGWPIQDHVKLGCTSESCSQRPMPPHRADIAERNKWVRAVIEARTTAKLARAALASIEWCVAHNAGRRSSVKQPRWAHVRDSTGHGSTYSSQLCMRNGADPDELVGGSEE